MKKFIPAILVFSLLFTVSYCKKDGDDGKTLETANTIYNVSDGAGSVVLDENTVVTLLSAYPNSVLGLSKDLDSYTIRLSSFTLFGKSACKVEAFLGDSKTPEATYAIIGYECYVYDKKTDSYLLMTVTGTQKVEASDDVTGENGGTATEGFVYNEDNNNALQKIFEGYTKEKLGLEKEITEYILVATGNRVTAGDGSTVYVARLYEKDGTDTGVNLAYGDNAGYFYDTEKGSFQKLS